MNGLVISRYINQAVEITASNGEKIIVQIVSAYERQARLRIVAPDTVNIERENIKKRKYTERKPDYRE